MGPGDGCAPTAGRRGRPTLTCAAAPPSLAPLPSVRMGRGDGCAPTAGRRGKPTLARAAAPPSLAPPPSVRMSPGDGSAPTGRRRKCHAAPASPVPAPSARTARGNGDGDATRKRKESSSPSSSPSKRGRRTHSERSSSRNGSAGGSGGGLESHAGEDDEGTAGSAARGDDPNGSGEGGAGHTTHGPPPVDPAPPSAPPKNAVRSQGGKVSVAHTPNIPPRFEGLIRNVTSLVPCESKGKSYECRSDQMNDFLNWTKTGKAFFFEWSDEKMEMICWMHDIQKKEFFKFTVNAAFSHEMDDTNMEKTAVAFSTDFSGDDDEYWSTLKNMFLNMFGSFDDDGSKDYDHLYVFTRVGGSIYFRNFKIISFPKEDDTSSELVLTEINTTFCLKLVIDQGTTKSSNIGLHLTKNETSTEMNLCPATLYSISNGQTGSCLLHGVDFGGKTYSILLGNGPYISSLDKLEGFNRSLAEIVVKEPLLKIKHIIGSVTNKTYCFARQRCKSILQSMFAEFAMLFESGKCISGDISIGMHNVLVKGSEVKLYGLHVTDYNEELAKRNVRLVVEMVRSCFPDHEIPIDLYELLEDLEKDPLNEIRTAKDDASLLKAECRRSLLININSEYMTNVEAKSDQIDDESKKIDQFTFFDGCPYAEDWKLIMKDNEFLVQVCNVGGSDDDKETDDDKPEVNVSVKEIMKKKMRVSKNTTSIKKMTKKKKRETNNGKLQFSSKRNFQMNMPEKARKDRIFPFRLGMADYILTAYFPLFLRFVQKRMREVKAQREKFNKTQL